MHLQSSVKAVILFLFFPSFSSISVHFDLIRNRQIPRSPPAGHEILLYYLSNRRPMTIFDRGRSFGRIM